MDDFLKKIKDEVYKENKVNYEILIKEIEQILTIYKAVSKNYRSINL